MTKSIRWEGSRRRKGMFDRGLGGHDDSGGLCVFEVLEVCEHVGYSSWVAEVLDFFLGPRLRHAGMTGVVLDYSGWISFGD